MVSRLTHIPGIGVNVLGDRADALADPAMLRLENLDTDLRPPERALQLTPAGAGYRQDIQGALIQIQMLAALRARAAQAPATRRD